MGIWIVAITCLPAAFAAGLGVCLAGGFAAAAAYESVGPVYEDWGLGLGAGVGVVWVCVLGQADRE